MKFEKISDDVNFDFVDEKELKKLDGEYDVQWFITSINSTERTASCKRYIKTVKWNWCVRRK